MGQRNKSVRARLHNVTTQNGCHRGRKNTAAHDRRINSSSVIALTHGLCGRKVNFQSADFCSRVGPTGYCRYDRRSSSNGFQFRYCQFQYLYFHFDQYSLTRCSLYQCRYYNWNWSWSSSVHSSVDRIRRLGRFRRFPPA